MKYWVVWLLLGVVLLSGCSTEDFFPEDNTFEEDAFLRGNAHLCIDEDETINQAMVDNMQYWIDELWREDHDKNELETCIANKSTAECVVLYAVYNDAPEACDVLSEAYVFEQYQPPAPSGAHNGYNLTVTCNHRYFCKTMVAEFVVE